MSEGSLKAVFFGTPALAVPTLRACHGGGSGSDIEVVQVCTRPPRRAGRGKVLRPSAVAECASELGIPTIAPGRLDADAAAAIREVRPDVAIAVAYGRLIPDAILGIPEHGVLNLHPSLLPRHRGTSPVQTAILNGDEFTGASIMLLDSGMDSGPVLWRSPRVAISRDIGAVELSEHLFNVGGVKMPSVVRDWCAGDLVPVPQDESQATFTEMLSKQDGDLDWSEPADLILRANRAYQPWPGTYTTWNGVNLKMLWFASASVAAPAGYGVPGTVWSSDGGTVHVTTGDGRSVTIEMLQLEGRRAMEVGEFIIGRPDFIGSMLGT